MDGEDFAMPSPKRQRTNSLHDEHISDNGMTVAVSTNENSTATGESADSNGKMTNGLVQDQNEMLDALMQHVESEATPASPAEPVSQGSHTVTDTAREIPTESTSTPMPMKMEAEAHDAVTISKSTQEIGSDENVNDLEPTTLTSTIEPTEPIQEYSPVEKPDVERAALQVDSIPATETIEHVEGEGPPEWEVDSSPYQSSTESDSSDSTSDDSDDDDEDADGDYAMLDPEEAARILMQGDAGSDDEGERSKNKADGPGLRTANEKVEDVPFIPEIIIEENMPIEELGTVEAIVENNVLIKGKVSGEYQVLESGSLLCLESRAVAGVVMETLGRIEQPLYTVRLRNEQEIQERGLSEKGTRIFYVPQHSTFVFTQPLKGLKGSDASNFHDEEVGDEEVEFSDDEAEAEHKRQLKLKRQGRLGESGKGRGAGRGGRGGQRGGYKSSPLSSDTYGAAYGNGSLEMNYDDVEEGEEGYTPLARPNNLHEMNDSNRSPEFPNPSHMPPPPFSDRGKGRGHHNHRGGRGHDRNNRGGRGNFRGNHNNRHDHNNRPSSFQPHNPNQPQHMNPYPNPFPPAHQNPYQQPQAPSAPSLTPQNPPYQYANVISPISPLSKSQFNFAAPGFPAPPSYNPNFQPQQQQWAQQMPGGFAPQFNNPAMMQFAQQFQQSQQQQQQQQQQNNGWQVNQAAAAEVQRQLEEMRRAHGGSGQ